jgi:hypothetical protein
VKQSVAVYLSCNTRTEELHPNPKRQTPLGPMRTYSVVEGFSLPKSAASMTHDKVTKHDDDEYAATVMPPHILHKLILFVAILT